MILVHSAIHCTLGPLLSADTLCSTSCFNPAVLLGAKKQKRADVVGAEALYKKAGAIDPYHANSIYNYAVLLDSSLKQQEVRPLMMISVNTAGSGGGG